MVWLLIPMSFVGVLVFWAVRDVLDMHQGRREHAEWKRQNALKWG